MARRSPSIRGQARDWLPGLVIVALVAAYVIARYAVDFWAALVFSQVVYLAAAFAAAGLSSLAALRAPTRSRAKWAWTLLAIASWLVASGEVLYARAALQGLPAAGEAGSAADILNALGVCAFVALVAVLSQADRLGWRRATQFALDLAIVVVLTFTLVYRFGVTRWVGAADADIAVEAVRLAVYSAVGVAMTAGVVLCLAGARMRRRFWCTLLFSGLGLFGLAVLLWPVWSLSALGGNTWPFADPVVTSLYLVGYCLVAWSGLVRVRSADVWDFSVSVEQPRLVWPGIASATVVFACVGVLAWAVLDSHGGTADQAVYFVGISVASACMVGRTALMSVALGEARDASSVDRTSGAFNYIHLAETVEEYIAAATRFGEPSSVAVVDVDDLAEVNSAHGEATGDQVLLEVAGALASSAGGRQFVFRHTADEFGVIMPGADSESARRRAHALSLAVDSVQPAGLDVTVSIGVATCPSDACDAQLLFRQAESAQRWARHHGRHRVVSFDERLLEVSESESTPAALESGAPSDIARALSAAADARDPANYRHSRNVAALSALLARALGLEAERISRIELAALLHDVGKIALSDRALFGRTTSFRERHREQEHATLGGRLVDALGVDGVSDWVRAHHERWDGRGYPDGLAGEQIPLEARIIALADAYDGMTTGKRYGAPMSKPAALQEIDLGLGSRFDPEVAEVFIEVVGSTGALGWSDEWPAA